MLRKKRKKKSKVWKSKTLEPVPLGFPEGGVVFDYETDGLSVYEGYRPFLAGFEDDAGRVVMAVPGTRKWNLVKDLVENPRIEKTCHNKAFEEKMSYHCGMTPRAMTQDTMGMAVLVNEYQKHNLGDLSSYWLDDDSKDEVKVWLSKNTIRLRKELGRDPNYSDVPRPLMEHYLEGDLDKTKRLEWMWREGIERDFGDLYKMEIALSSELVAMEDVGLTIDLPYVYEQIDKLMPRADAVEARLKKGAKGVKDFNPNSHIQLSKVLEYLDIDTGERTKPTKTNPNGSMKTRAELLEDIEHPFIDDLMEYRGLKKIVGTYLVPFTQKAIGSVVHGSFWQYGQSEGIKTGRLSSSNPNLQNIPGGNRTTNKVLIELGPIARKAIVAPKDHVILLWDYSKIEMVIFTCIAGDTRTMNQIKKGVDVYVHHGMNMPGLPKDLLKKKGAAYNRARHKAKETVLSLIYGQGLAATARKLHITKAEAKALRDGFFSGSPMTRDFMMRTQRDLMANGFVKDGFGRKYHVPQRLAYKSTNAVCQGPAATVQKKGIIRAALAREIGYNPFSNVHDEVLAIAHVSNWQEVSYTVAKLMEDTTSFELPIRVEASVSFGSWADKRELTPGEIQEGMKRARKRKLL